MNLFKDNKEILIGADISHHNWGQFNPSNFNFVFIKATEGKTWVDPKMNDYIKMISESNGTPYIGFYHFARAENNTAKDEANHFLDIIEPHLGNCLMCLDYEEEAWYNPKPDNWTYNWCCEVEYNTGVKPIVYVSASYARRLQKTLSEFPLWAAHYNVKEPSLNLGVNPPIMWQFTSKPFDMDIFFGKEADLHKYIIPR